MEQNPKATLDAALLHHRAGRLAEAERLYRIILAGSPNHPQATHHLGILALQCGKPDLAAQLIRRSIQTEPTAAAWNNLGEALRSMGRLAEAMDCYQRAIAIDGLQADAMANLGIALSSIKRLPEAEAMLRRALALAPNHISAFAGLASLLTLMQRHDDAASAWERAAALAPANPSFHRSLATAWLAAGDPYRARVAMNRTLELQPDDAQSHSAAAHILEKLNRREEALAAARKAVELAPASWQAHFELGGWLHRFGRSDEAIECFQKSISLNPRRSETLGAMGSVLQTMGRLDEATQSFLDGLTVDPAHRRLHSALSGARFAAGDFAGAVRWARTAVGLDPHDVDSHAALSFALLASGQFEEGFKEYEWRWRDAAFTTKPRDFDRPLWDGSDPAGRRILVHSEQGFGDIFQFLRYLPMIRQRGATVLVEASYKVAGLVRRMAADVLVYVSGTMLPDFDLHVPILSLPAIFGTTSRSIPACGPYLAADDALAAQWRPRVRQEHKLAVGLVWGGNAKPDPRRSATLAQMAPVARVPRVSLISLQTAPQAKEADDPPAGMQLINLGPELRDFAETTASVLANLDLLITIDTGVAHLAGAMGIRTWVLLPRAPDWRWVLQEWTCAWYPTMRLFRQPAAGDWESVIEKVAADLEALAERTESSATHRQ
jgi:tetratricopeptide (TPR) repeat protein